MENTLESILPFWKNLSDEEKQTVTNKAMYVNQKKGTLIHTSSSECLGLMCVIKGRVRVFINSQNGSEITLYRLLDHDVCVLSASCMMKNLNFSVNMETEEDTNFVIIPKNVYQSLDENNIFVKNYTLSLVNERFSDTMWVLNQYVFSNMAKRLADALLLHMSLTGSDELTITHEMLARDLGTAREVITRLLKQFQADNFVLLSRGKIKILDSKKLLKI